MPPLACLLARKSIGRTCWILLKRRDGLASWAIIGGDPTAANELIGRGDEDTLREEAALSS